MLLYISKILQLPEQFENLRFMHLYTLQIPLKFSSELTEIWIVYHLPETLNQMLPNSVIKMSSA